MKARQLMTADPQVVTPDESISRAAQIMRDFDIGMVPVVSDSGNRSLVGLITDRDIAVRHVAESHTDECRVGDHMTSDDIETVEENDDVGLVLDAMKRREVRRIAVTKNGKLLGVIAQADIAVANEVPKREVADVVKTVSEPSHR